MQLSQYWGIWSKNISCDSVLRHIAKPLFIFILLLYIYSSLSLSTHQTSVVMSLASQVYCHPLSHSLVSSTCSKWSFGEITSASVLSHLSPASHPVTSGKFDNDLRVTSSFLRAACLTKNRFLSKSDIYLLATHCENDSWHQHHIMNTIRVMNHLKRGTCNVWTYPSTSFCLLYV